jgi:putative transposase
MKRRRFSEGQIIGVLREHEAGLNTADLCRKHAISEATFYARKARYGDLGVSYAKRLKTLEAENARLTRWLTEGMLGNAVLKDLAAKTF